jgi:acyl-CoA reductase-like NAD-dependent aldehyde dehydrogenase
MTALSIPTYRFGEAYESLDRIEIADFRTGEICASVSSVNAGIITRDLRKIPHSFRSLQRHTTADMIAICKRAAKLFIDGDVKVAEGVTQSPDDYCRLVMTSGGLPKAVVRSNMKKIALVLTEMASVLRGLTRGLDLCVLDDGIHEQDGLLVSYRPVAGHLAVVLPSNSPGVNALWLPAIAMRIPVLLKPGQGDPWTPLRIIAAMIEAGAPPDAFGYYPTDHEGSGVISAECDRVMLFGDANTVERYTGDPRVSVHGPGYSKVLVGDDQVERWKEHLPVMEDSVIMNCGRSCVNASTIVVPSHASEVAESLAQRLAEYRPMDLDHPEANLAGFMNPDFADAINAQLEAELTSPGATDVSEEKRQGSRCVDVDGVRYLQPTVVLCEDREHALAKSEFLFPFASVVEVPQDDMLEWIGPTLVATAITDDSDFRRALIASAEIDRLNLGPIATPIIRWDQPHEGNLFELLYRRRAIQTS